MWNFQESRLLAQVCIVPLDQNRRRQAGVQGGEVSLSQFGFTRIAFGRQTAQDLDDMNKELPKYHLEILAAIALANKLRRERRHRGRSCSFVAK